MKVLSYTNQDLNDASARRYFGREPTNLTKKGEESSNCFLPSLKLYKEKLEEGRADENLGTNLTEKLLSWKRTRKKFQIIQIHTHSVYFKPQALACINK